MKRSCLQQAVAGVVCVFVIGAGNQPAHGQLTWSQATGAAGWQARIEHGAIAHDGRMWLLGGDTSGGGGGLVGDVWSSSDGANWTQATAAAAFGPRAWDLAAYSLGGRMWVVAGRTPSGGSNDVWYSTNGANWTIATSAAGFAKRETPGSVVFNGAMWILGGYPRTNDVWFSTNGVNWTLGTSSAGWSTREYPSSAAFNGRLWVLGGDVNNDVWYTTNGAGWTRATAAAAWSAREFSAANTYDGRLWILGGLGRFNDVWYSTDGANWTQSTASAPWEARFSHKSVIHAGILWILGGNSTGYVMRNDVWSAQVCAGPSISVHPAGQAACSGGSVTFNVTAGGTAPLGYQWRKSGGAISGATAASYTINPVVPGSAGSYDVVVSNACGSATSNAAVLTVNSGPSISSQPGNRTVTDCTPATFTVAASGTAPFSYQWRKGGGNLSDGGHVSGTTLATLTISPVGTADAGSYDVVVTNACGSATSSAATLTLVFGGRSDCDTDGIPDECQVGGGTRSWVGPSGGAFSTAAYWSPAVVPGSLSTASLVNATAVDNRCVLSTAGETAVCTTTVSAVGAGKQYLEIRSASVLRSLSGTTISPGGTIDLTGGELAGGTVSNSGTSLTGFGTVSANVTNTGLIEGSPGVNDNLVFSGASLSNQSAGTMRSKVASAVLIQSPSVVQAGRLEVQPGSAMVYSAALTNSAGGLITLYGGALAAAGLTNAVSATISGFGPIQTSVTNSGSINAVADMQVIGNLQNNGTVTIQSGILTVTGSLSGSGTIIGGFGGRSDGHTGLRIHGDLDLSAGDARQIDLTTTSIQLAGDSSAGRQRLEVLARDAGSRGVTLPDRSLVSIHTLRIGPGPGTVQLVDHHDNSPGAGPEVLYVEQLIMERGATLDLAGLRVYYDTVEFTSHNSLEKHSHVTDSVGGGAFVRIVRAARGLNSISE